MFAKIFVNIALASALVAGVLAKPVPVSRSVSARGFHSFNNWGGFSSLDNFDNFYGADNFCNSHFDVSSQTVVEQSQEVVCHTEQIEIIQQRLLVLQEMAKRIITEQICEVETQTIVFQQFHASLGSFSDDLTRHSGRHVGFDSGIASHFGSIVSSDNSLSTDDFGFSGHDLGSSTIIPSGSNWNDQFSPASVGNAHQSALDAISSF
ncbi:hypothetical protein BDQ12DRAFT_329085 [Crucibulum laeve]|uniref:Uncharacterized protein n=1 Tax=Crucibulum laeve TaxID=68775 RepID=A0A5C3LPZ0_9AGAR|nr:hypothetical protein BDQ12DRAFT_329085 [Crucibulum laeve]